MACKIHFWMLPYTGRYCVTPCTPPSSINKHKVGNKLSNFDQMVSTDFNSWLLFNNSYWNSFKKFNLHSWRLQVEASIVVKRHHHSWNLAKGAQMEIWNLWKKRKLIWITSFLHYISYITCLRNREMKSCLQSPAYFHGFPSPETFIFSTEMTSH